MLQEGDQLGDRLILFVLGIRFIWRFCRSIDGSFFQRVLNDGLCGDMNGLSLKGHLSLIPSRSDRLANLEFCFLDSASPHWINI